MKNKDFSYREKNNMVVPTMFPPLSSFPGRRGATFWDKKNSSKKERTKLLWEATF